MNVVEEFYKEIRKFGVRRAALLSNVSANTISSWLKGKRNPTLQNAQKVANVMKLEFLLFDMEE